jgi:hypothetical protein
VNQRVFSFDKEIYTTPFVSKEYSRVYVNVDNQAGNEVSLYLDDVIVTEE